MLSSARADNGDVATYLNGVVGGLVSRNEPQT